MTKEEAIQELQNCKELIQQDGQDYLDDRDIPLLDMAIEALSADGRTGEWIMKHDGVIFKRTWGECSYCGNTLDFDGLNAGRGNANYCPNCGAKMTKGGDSE